jgi:hypothetical protein
MKNIGPIMVAKVRDTDLRLVQLDLKILVHHKGVALEVVLCGRKLERVANLFELEVGDVEVNCVKVMGRVLKKSGL